MQRSLRPLALAIVSGVLAAAPGCRPTKAVVIAAKAKRARDVGAAIEAPSTLPTYRFNGAAAPGDSVDADGSLRLLRAGDRLLVSPARAVQVSSMRAPSNLSGGVPVPARLGGGFLFWTVDTLYRSWSYLGPLEVVTAVPTNALGLAFGQDSVLVSAEGGYRRQYRLDPRERPLRVALTPRNVLETAASDDGRVIALDAAGRALVSNDRGQTFRDVSSELSDIVELHGEASAAWFELENEKGVFVLPDGTLAHRPLPQKAPRKPVDRERAQTVDLVDRALSDGVWVSPGQAAVARGAELWIVDMTRQQPVGGARAVAPAGFECEALSPADGVLLACYHGKEGVAIVSHANSAAPTTEKRFEGEPRVAYARGVVLVSASCAGTPRDGVACVRAENGIWAEQDLSAQIAAIAPPDQRFQLFIPKQGGGAAALVAREAVRGEPDRWVLIGVRPEPILLDQKLPPIVRRMMRAGYASAGYQHSYRKRVDTSWVVLADGTLRGFAETRSVMVTPQGNVCLDPRTFEALARRSGRALARVRGQGLFQTQDFGETWLQVAAPLYDESGAFGWNADCSDVGCYLGNWVRNGWPNEPPTAEPVYETAPVTADEPAPGGPRLECRAAGEKKLLPPGPAAFDPALRFQETSSGSGSQRGLFGPTRLVVNAQKQSFSWLEPFEPSLTWKRSPLSKKVELPWGGGARPVLSSRLGHAAGVSLQQYRGGIPFWVAANGKSRSLVDWSGNDPKNGYVDSSGKLWLLFSNCTGTLLVASADTGARRIELGRAYLGNQSDRQQGVEKMFLAPCLGFENPESIAVGPQGELAALRLPSGNSPATVDDPALVLAPRSEPIPLAPWSTIELASSPACTASRDGYRALIQTPRSWLSAESHRGNGAMSAMSAIVRWSSERVCLEAFETPNDSELAPTGDARASRAWLVARFVGENPGAAIVTQKGEKTYRQPVSCRVTGAPSAASTPGALGP